MIHFETLGHENNEPLVFLHGLGAGAAQTTSALTQLNNHFLIAPDMPGHGQSKNFPIDQFSFNHFADRVIELMDFLGIEKSHLGGLSMGSGITLNLTLRYPERVKSIILLRPSWLNSPKPSHLELVARVHRGLDDSDPAFQALHAANPPVAKSISVLFGTPDTDILEKMWLDCPFTSFEQIQQIQNPALVLSSPKDDLHPQEVADQIAKHLKNATTAVLPARYYEPDQYQTALNQHINQFLNSGSQNDSPPNKS